MIQVQTIRGAVDTSALGRVLVHEHVFLKSGGAAKRPAP
jgi:predicted metal-dependent phosphotriesterase family hydrolase